MRPCLAVADGVTAGEADAGLDAVGDGCLAAGREDDGLVAAGGEVAEGVLVAVGPQEGTDTGFLVAVQGGFQTLGTEEGGRRVQQGEGAEQAEQEEQRVRRAAVEGAGGHQTAEHPGGGPGQVLALGQGAGEQGHQGPAGQDRHGEAGAQHGQRPPHGGAPGGGVELTARDDEQDQGEAADDEGGDGLEVETEAEAEGVGDDDQAEIDDHQPPGDPLARGGGGRQQEEEDGVGDVGADRHDQHVEVADDRVQQGAQRGDEGEQEAEQAEGAEEGRDALGHLAEEAAAGRAYRVPVLGPGGSRGGSHASDCRKGGAAPPVERSRGGFEGV